MLASFQSLHLEGIMGENKDDLNVNKLCQALLISGEKRVGS